MAKVYTQTARKQYVCSKCGKVIEPGTTYHKIVAPFRATVIRCTHCRPARSELTESEYLSWLWDLQDNLEDQYDIRSEDGVAELKSALEDQRDQLQERFDNIPESLQEAEAGTILQERIDSLDSAIDELDSLEFPDEDNIRTGLEDEDEDADEEDFDDEEDEDEDTAEEMSSDQTEEETDESAEEAFQEAWELALDDYAEEVGTIIGGLAE